MTNEVAENVAVVEVPGHGGGSPDILAVSFPMMVMTWITFVLLAIILYKMAWKPILKALDLREQSIRKALDDAEKAQTEAAASEARTRRMLQDAETEAARIVAEARTAAEATGRTLQERAQQEARALVDEARREIQSATDQARQTLRDETADLAVSLAGKVIGETMDETRHRALVDRLLKNAS